MNCFVVTDTNWDNVPLISKRLGYLSNRTRINTPYSKNAENIIKVANKLELIAVRHSLKKNNEAFGIKNCMQFMDFCMVFTDFIEYNNIPHLVIEICRSNNIPCFIFTNFTSDYFYNYEISTIKFKKALKDINEVIKPRILNNIPSIIIENNTKFVNSSIEESIEKIRERYSHIKIQKESRSIMLIDP